jgi:cytochrome P450
MQPSFNTSTLDLLSPTIEEFVKRVVRGLEKEANENGGIAEVSNWIFNFTFAVIGALALGTDFNGLQTREPHEYVKNSLKYFKMAEQVSVQTDSLTVSTCFLRGFQD